MTGSSVHLSGISYAYPAGSDVFRNISIRVEKGEIFSILGPNGTGKSTLLKCIAGLIPPQTGSVLLDGEDITGKKADEVARKLGFVPQTQVSPFPFLVRDIVLMGRAAHIGMFSTPSFDDEEIAYKALERVRIPHLATRPCTGISGGEWQLVLVARAIAQCPGILLLDEPTSHLDLGNQMRILDVIRSLADEGMTVIIATHFPDHALLTSGRVAILRDCNLIAYGPPDEVISEETMYAAYGVNVKLIELPDPVNRKICVPVTECKR